MHQRSKAEKEHPLPAQIDSSVLVAASEIDRSLIAMALEMSVSERLRAATELTRGLAGFQRERPSSHR